MTSQQTKASRLESHCSLQAWLALLDLPELVDLGVINIFPQLPGSIFIRQRAPLHQVVDHRLWEQRHIGASTEIHTTGSTRPASREHKLGHTIGKPLLQVYKLMLNRSRFHRSKMANLAIILIHTVGLVQDAIHLHIIWVEGFLFLQSPTWQ